MRALPFALALLVGCSGPKDDDTAATDDTGSDGRVPETPFDERCAGQVMFQQVVGTTGTLEIDWSALTADSAGAPFASSEIQIVHWYILGMPVSTLDVRLCDEVDLSVDVLGANAASPEGGTSMSMDIGTEWNFETGVIALYDIVDELSERGPRAAAVFTFDEASSNQRVVLEDRGDVWTAP